ncbi:MAG: hypothetical protein AVDCRST_MAG54-3909, partial [uncultured Actinomycetospora sp.]
DHHAVALVARRRGRAARAPARRRQHARRLRDAAGVPARRVRRAGRRPAGPRTLVRPGRDAHRRRHHRRRRGRPRRTGLGACTCWAARSAPASRSSWRGATARGR